MSDTFRNMKNTAVGRSQLKTFLLILAAFVFVLIGLWMILHSSTDLITKIIGGIVVLFFGTAIVIGVKVLIKDDSAIEFNNFNLIIEPNSSKRTVIPWNKIVGFDELSIKGAKIIIIKVFHPQEWINEESNSIKKTLMNLNYKTYESPFNITSVGLNISHRNLLESLNKYHNQRIQK